MEAAAGEEVYEFDQVAMLPQEGDSAAVAKDLLPAKTRIRLPDDVVVTLSAPCLEGHRFLILNSKNNLQPGEPLLSWGLPFGHACLEIRAGDVLLNQKTADALRGRLTAKSGPEHPGASAEEEAIRSLLQTQPVNVVDLDVSPDSPFVLEKEGFTAVGTNHPQTREEPHDTFLGYRRSWGVVGTRNHVLVIGLTSSSMPLLAPLKTRWRQYEEDQHDEKNAPNGTDANTTNFDGVRIVAHTEGESSSDHHPHNTHKLHRCLAGWICHANAGAVIVVTTGREQHVTRETLLQFVASQQQQQHSSSGVYYPAECFQSPHLQFVQLSSSGVINDKNFLEPLDGAVHAAVQHAATTQRDPCPLSELCIALQCGGSDSFSGLTGNPLTGAVASRFITEHGGKAILAESPELVGAEPYILSRVADEATAQQFVATTEAYKAYGARHGLSVAGNPSGGNLYRGLSNIVLKSLGAARKKPPNIALDCVLEYGEPMPRTRMDDDDDNNSSHDGPKYYAFMDSPGNDLESIAGQVASGCNLIIFITGNGAMTNFPFVPTIKVVTTDKRFQLLKHDMDVNAGPYGHGGADAERAVDDMFRLCVRVSSGIERSKGEARGHSQVSVWRNWAIGDDDDNINHDNKDQPDRGVPGEEAAVRLRRGGGRKNNNNQLQLCSHVVPHEVRPDPPPLLRSAALLEEKPMERVPFDNGSSSHHVLLRPWTMGATFSLIPTSLCSSGVAENIKDFLFTGSQLDHHHIACPNHTEGCGAAGDAVYERRYQRLMLGHALHPSVGRALFLEHGCEKTHNDYFRNVLNESGALAVDNASSEPASMYGFWSLQGHGGFDNAKRHIAEYFDSKTSPPSPPSSIQSSPQAQGKQQLFGVPWSARPISVGLLVDPVLAMTADNQLLAPALATVVRFLSRLHVHSVIPVNSPLVSSSRLAKNKNNQATTHSRIIPPSVNVDMEDYYAPPRQSKKAQMPLPVSKDEMPAELSDDQHQHTALLNTLFAVEALVDTTIPQPTLLPGQMVNQRRRQGNDDEQRGGLHVMDLPEGCTWDETVSCLSPATDVILLVAAPCQLALLPGSCLAPTLRRATPSSSLSRKDENGGDNAEAAHQRAWQQWTEDTCAELSKVLRSPLVVGGALEDNDDDDNPAGHDAAPAEELELLQKSLFSLTTFVVPRGHAVSF